MHDQTLHRRRKYFCRYCLQVFGTEEILVHHVKDYFKINGKRRIQMPKKGEYVKFKIFQRKIKSQYMTCVDFESVLIPEHNGKQNLEESYTNKI